MIDPITFLDPVTGKIDDLAYSLALQLAGLQCPRCKNILASPMVTPGVCGHCRDLERSHNAATHPCRFRCPRCGHQYAPDAIRFFDDITQPGQHAHTCEVCGQHFTFIKHARLGYTSEPRFVNPQPY